MKGRRITIPVQRDIALEEFDVPTSVGHGELLAEVAYSLISPGTELSGYNSRGQDAPRRPGYTAVGKALEVGAGRDPKLKGRTVLVFPEMGDTNHCHATHKLLGPGGLAMLVPDGLDARRACFARIINVGLSPYGNAPAKTSGAVFVIGLGLVGNVTAQIGRVRGFHVIAADTNPARRRRATESGIDDVIDPDERDPVEAVKALTNGEGASLTINATGRAALFPMALAATATGGEVSTLGGARGHDTGDLGAIFGEIHGRHLTVRGGWEMCLPRRPAPASKAPSTENNLRDAFRWLASGAIRLDAIWTHTIRPEDFKTAYDALNRLDDEYLGVVVDWR